MKKVWEHFGCTLGDYSDLCLTVDIMLLADVFENFSNICMKIFNIDLTHYYTDSGFSFDYMLKYTEIKLELRTYELRINWMFEKGIKG